MRATPFNQKTIDEFHAKNGRGVGPWGDHALLMTSKGARSGEAITTPLVFGRDGDDYVIVASKGGAPLNPTWLGNIKANPEVEVEVPTDAGTEKFKARARVVDDRAEHDRLYEEMTRIWPSFADYQTRTERLIPVVVLERAD
ncbi:MAG: nitroreductase family deazaflavin-dependent oxidoreductase [Candidatus Dormiibacterota bacterium]